MDCVLRLPLRSCLGENQLCPAVVKACNSIGSRKAGDCMEEKHSVYTLPIHTPNGMLEVLVRHRIVDEDGPNMWVSICAVLQGRTMCFDAETTAEALIQFDKALPSGWHIKCCLSCRYGNFCPVGNADCQLFCVTEFEPKEIRDLWYVTENDAERCKRSRNFFHLCDRYMPQSSHYFTYSDYELKENGE